MSCNYNYFLTIVEEGSLTKAAEKLYLSQPALSKYLNRLEQNFGVSLFERDKTPLRLTPAGELYLEYIKKTSFLDKELAMKFEEISTHDRGRILLGMTFYRASCLLPEVLPYFRHTYPNIDIVLTEGNAGFLVNELLKEKIDLCIANPIDTLNYNLLNYDILFKEEIYLSVSKKYPELDQYLIPGSEQEKIQFFDLKQIEDKQFFMTNSYQSMTYIIENALRRDQIHLNNVFRTTNLTTAINLAATGLGFVFVPQFSITSDLFPRDMLFFKISEPSLYWEHAVFYKKDACLSSHCKTFISTVKQLYKERRT